MEKSSSQKTMWTVLFALIGLNLILSVVALIGQNSFQTLLLQEKGDKTLFAQIVNHPKYQEEMKKSLESMVKTLDNPNAATNPQTQPQAQQQEQNPSGKLTADQVKSVLNDTYIKGSKNASISIIEYSDLECPFCKRHHGAGVVDKLLTTFGKDVNYIYKHFPLSFHPTAQKAAEGAECVAQI
jgi:protein-disulfide isomerase